MCLFGVIWSEIRVDRVVRYCDQVGYPFASRRLLLYIMYRWSGADVSNRVRQKEGVRLRNFYNRSNIWGIKYALGLIEWSKSLVSKYTKLWLSLVSQYLRQDTISKGIYESLLILQCETLWYVVDSDSCIIHDDKRFELFSSCLAASNMLLYNLSGEL